MESQRKLSNASILKDVLLIHFKGKSYKEMLLFVATVLDSLGVTTQDLEKEIKAQNE